MDLAQILTNLPPWLDAELTETFADFHLAELLAALRKGKFTADSPPNDPQIVLPLQMKELAEFLLSRVDELSTQCISNSGVVEPAEEHLSDAANHEQQMLDRKLRYRELALSLLSEDPIAHASSDDEPLVSHLPLGSSGSHSEVSAEDNSREGSAIPAQTDINEMSAKSAEQAFYPPWYEGESEDDEAYPIASSPSKTSSTPAQCVSGKATYTEYNCTVCGEHASFRTPCGHYYDLDCLGHIFELAVCDETHYPPQCCGHPIDIDTLSSHVDPAFIGLFCEKSIEFSTSNRLYCPNPNCSTFIGPATTPDRRRYKACPECYTLVCTACKALAHAYAPCMSNAEEQVLALANSHRWQRCYQCQHLVERVSGYDRMRCPCGTQFCYTCRGVWESCQCSSFKDQTSQTVPQPEIVPGASPELLDEPDLTALLTLTPLSEEMELPETPESFEELEIPESPDSFVQLDPPESPEKLRESTDLEPSNSPEPSEELTNLDNEVEELALLLAEAKMRYDSLVVDLDMPNILAFTPHNNLPLSERDRRAEILHSLLFS